MKGISMDRRTFVGAMAALGAASAVGVGIDWGSATAVAADSAFPKPKRGNPVEASVDPKTGDVTVNPDVVVRYSACLGCYSSCGNRVKIDRESGRMLTVGGNPYQPSCCYPYLNFDEPLEEAFRTMSYANGKGNLVRASVCGRGNGTMTAYTQPNRITTPLKRAGKRGEGKWKAISWDQLIEEVVEGGKLFEEIGEDREIEGYRAVHDTTTPINADYPGLGPVSNQLVAWGGRSDGRGGVNSRFYTSYGSINTYGHGST